MNIENQLIEDRTAAEEPKLELTPEVKRTLNETGKWGNFLSILAFIGIGLLVILGFFMSIMLAFIPMDGDDGMPFPPFLFGLLYLIMGGVYFIPVLYLFRFAGGIQKAVRTNNQNQLINAFKNLKAHYRFIGIFTIVMFCLYIVMLVVMLFVGVFSGLSTGFPGLSA